MRRSQYLPTVRLVIELPQANVAARSHLERRAREPAARQACQSEASVAGVDSAVDDHRGAADPVRFVAREEQRHRRDIVGLPRARYRLHSRHRFLRAFLAAGNSAMYQRSIDAARANAVDANLV